MYYRLQWAIDCQCVLRGDSYTYEVSIGNSSRLVLRGVCILAVLLAILLEFDLRASLRLNEMMVGRPFIHPNSSSCEREHTPVKPVPQGKYWMSDQDRYNLSKTNKNHA